MIDMIIIIILLIGAASFLCQFIMDYKRNRFFIVTIELVCGLLLLYICEAIVICHVLTAMGILNF